MEEEELQNIANRINLGKHEHLITAANEEGQKGRFIVHRPTMREEIKIGVLYASLKTAEGAKAPVEIDEQRDNVAFMCATLFTVIDRRPDWFPKDPSDCFDAGLIEELFTQYCEWKNSFRRQLPSEPAPDSSPPEPAKPGISV